MIRIKVLEKDNIIKSLSIKGHAEYAEYGKDIVCAAVSATYLCTLNAILCIEPSSIQILSDNNIEVINYNEITNKLLQNMVKCLIDLERQYPKNIKINKEEK